jgi:type VI secretion system protein ImpA
MRLSGILDLERLVAPISPDHPVGFDPRIEPSASILYRAIRSARSAARTAERRIATMEDAGAGIRPDWRPVLDLAIQILAEESKDLEIVAYLIEALVRLHGFAGLHEGFRLCRLLLEDYWQELYPRPDGDGLATRIAPLMGLNGEGSEGTLIVPILNIPLTCSTTLGEFACAHHDQATSLERIADPKTRARRVEQGAVSLKKFLEAVSDTPLAFYLALDEQIEGSLQAFHDLTALLDGLCGEQAPHSSNIKNALLRCQEVVLAVAGDRIKRAATPVAAKNCPAKAANGIATVAAPTDFESMLPASRFDLDSELREDTLVDLARGIPSREHALTMLEAVATYFRETEPHSPIAYNLEQTVRWGRMPLPELVADLIPDKAAREHYFRMVGISEYPGRT